MREDEERLIACLLNSTLMIEHTKQLKPEYFEFYGEVFEGLSKGDNDILSIAKKTGIDKEMLLDIATLEPNPLKITVETYCYKIISDYKQRETSRLKSKISDPDELMQALQEISSIDYRFEKSVDISKEFLTEVEMEMQGKENPDIIPTGFQSIDKMIKGFKKSELVIIGGRPASGKSALGVNMAVNMAKQGKKVLFVSLEMTNLEIHERIVKSETEIADFKGIAYQDFEFVANTSKKTQNILNVIDNGNITLETLEKRVKTLKEQNNVDIVFIDHIGILETSKRYNSRYEQITNISRRLKVMAKDNDIPVVALCQLNRGLENRELKAPTMADLRDSGAIEQDANIIMFIYRPEYHLMQQEPEKNKPEHDAWEEALLSVKGKAYAIISKNRRGMNGRQELTFRGDIYKFGDGGAF